MLSEGTVAVGMAAAPKGVHMINDVLREREELHPTIADQMMSGG